MLQPGQPAPFFTGITRQNPTYGFDTVGGRYIILCFYGTVQNPHNEAIIQEFVNHKEIFDPNRIIFMGVCVNQNEQNTPLLADHLPGLRHFWDVDYAISTKYGAMQSVSQNGEDNAQVIYNCHTLILDPRLRVIHALPFTKNPKQYVDDIINIIPTLDPIPGNQPANIQAPILVIPRVFPESFCDRLIEFYHNNETYDSGFMQNQGEKTVGKIDHGFKRRTDCTIQEQAIKDEIRHYFSNNIAPEMKKSFQFDVSRMERYLIACYDGKHGGHFSAHRDNTTFATAHRQFACTINLNTGEYEGGGLKFPEFGNHIYSSPKGGAILFSCSLLHQALPVTKGKRYAFLPFLYSDSTAKIRQQTKHLIVDAKRPNTSNVDN